MRNRSRIAPLITIGLAALLLVLLPLLSFPFYRDNLATHFQLRGELSAQLRDFTLPLWNPSVGGGQPLGGNPNSLAFYPTFALHLFLSPFAAYTLHFVLHWLAGALAMAALLRRESASEGWSAFGGLLWLVSGAAVSLFAFYNLITAALWIPACLLALGRLGRRPDAAGVLLLGASFGLFTLAGEPVMLLGTAAVCAVLALRHLTARFAAGVAAAVAVAAIVASPMLLAWSEVASELERGSRSYSAETVLAASLSPWEMAEIALGPVRGLITDRGASGLAASGTAERWPPLFILLFVGALAVPAIVSAGRELRLHQVAAVLLFFLAAGAHNPFVRGLVESVELLRVGRYPEKLAVPACALLVILVTGWLQRETRSRIDRTAIVAGIAGIAALAVAALGGAAAWSDPMRQRILLFGAFAVVVLAIGLLNPTPNRRRLLALLTILPAAAFGLRALPLDWRSPYESVPPAAEMFSGERIVRVVPSGVFGRGSSSIRELSRISAASADPTWGGAHGVAYALEKSPDGMYSFLSRIVHERFASGDSERMARWAAMVGARAIVSETALDTHALSRSGTFAIGPRRVHVFEVSGALPMATGVGVIESTRSINEAVDRIEDHAFDPRKLGIGPPGWESEGIVTVTRIERAAGKWKIELTAEEAGALLVNESFFRAWRAVDQDGRTLGTFPLNIDRLGIRVPAGTSRVSVSFGRRHGWIAAGWVASWLVLIAASAVLYRESRSSVAIASPAR
ncbi:MAG: hypothetical protein ABR524_02660 [Thermoanaerobaculia bacterium]